MTTTDIYKEYIRRAQIDFDNAVEKIKKCYDEIIKEGKLKSYELDYTIRDCATKETNIFKDKWFFSAPQEIYPSLEFYQCAADTYLMYVDLINYPMKIINENESSQ